MDTKYLNRQYDKLMQLSESHHGYWLVNHSDVIKQDLIEMLNNIGLNKTHEALNNDTKLNKRIYAMIEGTR